MFVINMCEIKRKIGRKYIKHQMHSQQQFILFEIRTP
jgi:hypothetical protein